MTDSVTRGVPTYYGGVNFRSRLEARWAAMFDLLGWRWDYEPLDLDGWIPDFVIHGIKPILVEVKPIFEFDEALGRKIQSKAQLDIEDWSTAHLKYEAIVCGAGLVRSDYLDEVCGIGWLWDWNWSAGVIMDIPANFRPEGCKLKFSQREFGLSHDNMSYGDRVTGWRDGGHLHPIDPDELETLWRFAGNRVQWRAVNPWNAPHRSQ